MTWICTSFCWLFERCECVRTKLHMAMVNLSLFCNFRREFRAALKQLCSYTVLCLRIAQQLCLPNGSYLLLLLVLDVASYVACWLYNGYWRPKTFEVRMLWRSIIIAIMAIRHIYLLVFSKTISLLLAAQNKKHRMAPQIFGHPISCYANGQQMTRRN
jgi:hypothetical protein